MNHIRATFNDVRTITTECFERLNEAVSELRAHYGDCRCECGIYLSHRWDDVAKEVVIGLWVAIDLAYRDSVRCVDNDMRELEWLRESFWNIAKILSKDGTGKDVRCRMDNVSGLSIKPSDEPA